MSETRKRTPPRSKKILSDDDLYLFNEGRHLRLYRKLGAQRESRSRRNKVHFAVWAPDADQVSVVGSFNDWNGDTDPLRPIGSSGVWAGSVNDVIDGSIYKYRIHSRTTGETLEKADPYAFAHEVPPKTASVVWSLDYDWSDDEWMRDQRRRNSLEAPMSIYEVHIGSWKRVPEDDYRSLSYRELAPQLADYVQASGFTHVEFMPVMEHPFFGSWGYQVTGFYAPSSRYGTPQDFMYLVDYLHQRGIGVLLDWVPSHFPTDPHGLGRFDGTHLYEHADPRQGIHPDWNSYVFNYGRNEVRSFLLSNAMYWLDVYHADGLRVDAVASMLYLDYSRAEGEWIPNKFGGRENLEAIDFLRQFNEDVYREFPDVQTIAEESTAWPMVSRPTYLGGLGFGLKWDMGWMHDTLEYMRHDPVHRKFHHNMLTFRMIYAFTENFVLALSHDEVTHGKGSLLGKMPGDDWQKLANLRLLLSYMFFQPGKKLLFMGDEIGQWSEWAHDGSIDWDLLNYEPHQGILRCLQTLNALYRDDDALHQLDVDPAGFSWIDGSDSQQSVISMLRRGRNPEDSIVGIFNFTPVPRYNYLVGVPSAGYWREIFNSDASEYGGSGMGNLGGVWTNPASAHGQFQSLTLTVPPLGALLLKADGGGEPAE